GELKNLQSLYLGGTQISELPEWLGELKNLQSLYLGSTQVSELPERLGECKNLQYLDLSCTRIEELPEWISQLKELENLNLANCKLDSLPKWTPRLKVQAEKSWFLEEKGINLYQTTLTKQPISLFFQPPELIEAYYDAPKRVISDVKVIFLGHGDVGKTHTIQRILHDDAMETPEAPYTTGTTHGIIITEHTPKDCENLHIHFWDFGGQHIMNSMHRCFLTERTCYVVVVSTRLPDPTEQARYFLRNIRSFAPDAPVILFVNQFEEGSNEGIDYPGLCEEFSKNIVGKVECSAKNAPIPIFHQLSECIAKQAGKLDSAGMEFPEQWDNVRRELLQMKNRKNYVDLEEYYRICQKYPLVQGEQDTEHYKEICNWLLEWFHNLGVCFNYYRDGEDGQTEHLPQYKVLNPEWLTNAIYIILFRGRAYAEQGVLKRSVLEDMLEYVPLNYARDAQRLIDGLTTEGTLEHIAYSPEECGYVLEVMRKFRLSYPVSQEKEFIPVLCPNQTPKGIRPAQSVQHIRYELEYLYLPDSVVHRLMIRYYHLLNMNQCWQKGMRMEIPMMGLVAVVDMGSGKPILRIDVYAQTEAHETWELLAPLLKDIRDINGEMNLQDVKEFVVMEQGEETKSYDVEEDILIPKEEGESYVRWGRTKYDIDEILHLIYGEKNCYRQVPRSEEEEQPKGREESFKQELQRRSQENSPIVIENHGAIYLSGMSVEGLEQLGAKLAEHTSALQENTSALQENTSVLEESTESWKAVLAELDRVSPDLAEAFATKLAELLSQQQDENLKALAQMIQQEPAEKKGRFAKLKGFFEGTDTVLSILANGTALVTTLFPLVQQALTGLGPEAAPILQSVQVHLQQIR
ncbi:MAG: leucine-rich repeat domain-containing protein, partial [Lachnospiraceae bacterium]|nr:leucine-rich repeat domain-containing protein [Lachnospiraceae bacterium]